MAPCVTGTLSPSKSATSFALDVSEVTLLTAILSIVVMGSLLSVTIGMETGRQQMPKIYGMAGRNLGALGFQLFWYVLLPASLPYIVSGLKQGWVFAWRSIISGEMIFVSLGLGELLMMGRDLNDMSQVIAVS